MRHQTEGSSWKGHEIRMTNYDMQGRGERESLLAFFGRVLRLGVFAIGRCRNKYNL
jgi:hypothetical protein